MWLRSWVFRFPEWKAIIQLWFLIKNWNPNSFHFFRGLSLLMLAYQKGQNDAIYWYLEAVPVPSTIIFISSIELLWMMKLICWVKYMIAHSTSMGCTKVHGYWVAMNPDDSFESQAFIFWEYMSLLIEYKLEFEIMDVWMKERLKEN